ncbi:hypothetical protein NQ152_00195 [Microbacterium sp. zg.B48]|uniref:hypothetical protein n=1 Tax=Microbacterium sp. zg.B48 TaxID=2969408 RepID=UPI00214B91F0|nr:hypothetical protein [Microbacterium sp. zg.B48]MCR2761923.1 hypothetical protein [Microbacterium sp. zg.B48]
MPVEGEQELAAVAAMRARLGLVPAALERWDRVAKIPPKPGSQMALDDIASGWRRVSHALTQQLHHAADTLTALTVLIPPEGPLTIPYVAHYPVARSALEAASLALWVLAPDDPRLRVDRHIRNAWREVSADAELKAVAMNAIAADPSLGLTPKIDRGRKETKAWKSKHVAQIRACAKVIGVADPTQSDRTVGFAEIVRDASVATGVHPAFGEMVWREISGLSHPSMMRAVLAMNVEELVDHVDGTFGAIFTSNTAKGKYSIEAAFLAFTTAVELFGRRKVTPGDPSSYASGVMSR